VNLLHLFVDTIYLCGIKQQFYPHRTLYVLYEMRFIWPSDVLQDGWIWTIPGSRAERIRSSGETWNHQFEYWEAPTV